MTQEEKQERYKKLMTQPIGVLIEHIIRLEEENEKNKRVQETLDADTEYSNPTRREKTDWPPEKRSGLIFNRYPDFLVTFICRFEDIV